jgi:peptidoglycan/LPS O-acetylase OafA/YrhL
VRLYQIDLARFIAALAVLLFHYSFRYWNLETPSVLLYPEISAFTQYGYLGVDLFFMISGFVILMSAENKSLREFIVSRVVRLYPVYWFGCIFIFAFSYLWPVKSFNLDWSDLFINLTMFQAYFERPNISTVFWTLVIELQFYILICVALYTGLIKKVEWLLLGWLGLSIVADYIPVPNFVRWFLVLEWCYYFVAGAIFYRVWKDRLTIFRAIVLTLAALQALKHAYWYMLVKERMSGIDYEPTILALIIISFFGFFILLSTNKLPGNYKLFAKLGALTYPLYLIHSAVGHAIMSAYLDTTNRMYLLSITTVAMLVFAYSIVIFVERPIAPLLKRKMKSLLRLQPSSSYKMES